MSWNDTLASFCVNCVDGERTYQNISEHACLGGLDGTIWAATSGFEVIYFLILV